MVKHLQNHKRFHKSISIKQEMGKRQGTSDEGGEPQKRCGSWQHPTVLLALVIHVLIFTVDIPAQPQQYFTGIFPRRYPGRE